MDNLKTLTLPIIRTNALQLVIFSVIFVALALALPLLAHQFNLAGPTYLPMHLFVFVGALLFGWRLGLVVGLLSPLANYFVSGMPLLAMIPPITLELGTYGLAAGLLRGKEVNLWLALIVAMIAGRLALLAGIAIFNETPAWSGMIRAVKLGWPGILIQLVLVVPVVRGLKNWLADKIKA